MFAASSRPSRSLRNKQATSHPELQGHKKRRLQERRESERELDRAGDSLKGVTTSFQDQQANEHKLASSLFLSSRNMRLVSFRLCVALFTIVLVLERLCHCCATWRVACSVFLSVSLVLCQSLTVSRAHTFSTCLSLFLSYRFYNASQSCPSYCPRRRAICSSLSHAPRFYKILHAFKEKRAEQRDSKLDKPAMHARSTTRAREEEKTNAKR